MTGAPHRGQDETRTGRGMRLKRLRPPSVLGGAGVTSGREPPRSPARGGVPRAGVGRTGLRTDPEGFARRSRVWLWVPSGERPTGRPRPVLSPIIDTRGAHYNPPFLHGATPEESLPTCQCE